MTEVLWSPLFLAACLALYVLGKRRAAQAAQSLRLQLAEAGERLLADDRLPADAKDHIRFILDNAFGMGRYIIPAYVFLPFLALLVVFRQRALSGVLMLDDIKDDEARALFNDLTDLHDRISFYSSPILASLLQLQILVIVGPAFLLRSAIKGRAPRFNFREIVFAEEGRLRRRLAG